jgi:hypothetical protein
MDPEVVLPRRLINYIHDIGVRALDHLAENVKSDVRPQAVRTLADNWKAMSTEDKERFVDRIAAAVIEVVAASALLPVGRKIGKKAAKSARRLIKRRAKALKKSARRLMKAGRSKKKAKKAA